MNKLAFEQFTIPLLKWYDANKREMIWRDHPDPYYIWISEIMLQQTRIEAAKSYFIRFTEQLPNIESLANVREDRLMKLWEGLGYYNRARNLKKTAEILVERYDGKLPDDYDLLLSLPGIGPYTAGAIASIAYGVKAPAVDGNVLRVVMRYLKCDEDISKMSIRREVENMLLNVMPERSGDFNQAIMELGEVVCIPNGVPLCKECPLYDDCQARICSCQEEYPKKAEKKPRRIEQLTIIVYEYEDMIGIAKRADRGLLAGLYEFPSFEEKMTVKRVKELLNDLGMAVPSVTSLGMSKHIFSHVEWHMKGFHVNLEDMEDLERIPGDVLFVTKEELKNEYTLPVAFHYYLNQIVSQ